MLVKARYVRRDELPAELLTPNVQRAFSGEGVHRALVKAAEYVVYAEETTSAGLLYFIWDAGSSVYPFAYTAELFEVVDPRVSRLWESRRPGRRVRSIPAWAQDEGFYEHLVEGDDGGKARLILDDARNVMDFEFTVPTRVQAVGERLGDGWVECRACDHIWEERSSVFNEMCTCPNCHLVLELKSRSPRNP